MSPALEKGNAKQAELLRRDGNDCFKKGRIGAAIDAYTGAIALCPDVLVYWTNRALCFRKREEWDRVEEDCRKALQLDSASVKARYMLGLALMERQEFADGAKELERALELEGGLRPLSGMGEDIWSALARARYMEWEKQSIKRTWRRQCLKEACEKSLKQHHLLGASEDGEGHEDDAAGDHFLLDDLTEVFNQAAEADRPTEVPNYLCCQITLDIFRDPVITRSGVTYERAVILEHLHKVGKFDPVTREALEECDLVPNLAIKQAVEAFLKKHGWAYGNMG